MKPIFLLADSQTLFSRGETGSFAARLREALAIEAPLARAAYLGASNGEAPEFFELFTAAMAGIGVAHCRHVRADGDAAGLGFLETADLILLAGGDVEQGFRAFEAVDLPRRIRERWLGGAVVIGISAGAIQLGRSTQTRDDRELALLALVPFAVGVHDEPEWRELSALIRSNGQLVGLGIPSGGGAVVHPDLSVEPLRKTLTELRLEGGELRSTELTAAR